MSTDSGPSAAGLIWTAPFVGAGLFDRLPQGTSHPGSGHAGVRDHRERSTTGCGPAATGVLKVGTGLICDIGSPAAGPAIALCRRTSTPRP